MAGFQITNFKNIGTLGLVVSLGLFSQAASKKLISTSGSTRVQLIELYSSESCSSCPPADKWVSSLKNDDGLWKTFVPVVFHVDYWNHLGWKDGLSSELMTKRQVDVAQQWPSPSVYTPAVVVDGKEWRAWREAKKGVLPSAEKNENIELQIFQESDGAFSVKATGLRSKKKFIIRAAQLGMDLNSNVTAGENSGLNLKHDFVVLNWDSKPVDIQNFEVQFQFKKLEQKSKRLAIAVWIEEQGNPTPLQATGAYL